MHFDKLKRREFISLLGGAAAWPVAARAQQPDRMRLIGVLMAYAENDSTAQSWLAAFRAALAKLGWTEGSNLRIELRWSAADADRMRTLARELVDLRPDAIFGVTTPAVGALARETRTIPIVFAGVSDPIGAGYVDNLARPGGNITGFMSGNGDPALGGKWVELLKQIAPRTERVALLSNPATAVPLQVFMPSIQAAASSLAVQVSAAPVHGKDEIEGVIAAQARDSGGGLIVIPDVFNDVNREPIIALAARYSVPTIYFNRFFSEPGGLISYGDVRSEQFRLAAGYIDRVLKGEKPSDLPVQVPTRFELIINLKTAKALGLTISDKLLATADEVIE
ncbi:MAG TPA: ABC transporter substrate-binding protein [Stellaceae bacterium]|nr:ABC transporter substrate-binding protein [Stellaceae bacterium]